MTERLHFHFSLFCIGEGNDNPLQCSCLESPRDWGAWWAAVYGVAQSRTRLKWLSSSSGITINKIAPHMLLNSYCTMWPFYKLSVQVCCPIFYQIHFPYWFLWNTYEIWTICTYIGHKYLLLFGLILTFLKDYLKGCKVLPLIQSKLSIFYSFFFSIE